MNIKKKFYVESTFATRFENGNFSEDLPTHANIDVFAIVDEKNEKIYQVYAKNRDDGSFVLEPIPMKVIKIQEFRGVTFEGIKKNDIDNRWGIDYSNYSIQFIMSAMYGLTESFGTACFSIKDKNLTLVYQ